MCLTDAFTGADFIPEPPTLPPPPVPPTETLDPTVDNISNADSGVADVTGDGLGYHAHAIHSDSNSTTSNASSEDASPMKSGQNESEEVGNMYLGMLGRNKSKKQIEQKPKQEIITKMTFAAPKKNFTKSLPPPIEEKSVKKVEEKPSFPPTPTQFKEAPPPVKPQQNLPDEKKKHISEWTVDDVCNWLEDLGLSMYEESFRDNEISGEHLPELGKDELMEMGIKRVGHRLTFDKAVKKLQQV